MASDRLDNSTETNPQALEFDSGRPMQTLGTDSDSERVNVGRRKTIKGLVASLVVAIVAPPVLAKCGLGEEDKSEPLECDTLKKGPRVDFKRNEEGKPECSFEGNLARAVVKLDGVDKECGKWPVTLVLMGTFLRGSEPVEESIASQEAAMPGEYVFHEILKKEGILSLRIQATDARGNRTLTVPVEKL